MRTRLYALSCPPRSSVLGVSCFNQLDHVEAMARMYGIIVCYCNLQFADKCKERYNYDKRRFSFFKKKNVTLGHHGLTDGPTKEYRDVNDLSGHAVIQWSYHVHDY